ncbi:hypothetical protein GCK72_022613 [Caenorhabditis remanei]|uniref:JmjC domain-containing protein n=1 Tax=Caenorhabditis remanei TaxID=31234 RepID=A0A6A5FU60_CAERE|nr:hypothetical protein GCK72_022613 [Caenorhabditis remanei]KAF1746160.1 hypothetical protein GCK72_022613 [Caenorhabditis remanei]
MTMSSLGLWSFYDVRGSLVKPFKSFKMGKPVKQGHAVDLSYCITSCNGQKHLWTWNEKGKPVDMWNYSDKEWFLGLIKKNNSETIFAFHGQHHNSKLTITDVNHLSEYESKSFHRYDVKDSKQTLFDVTRFHNERCLEADSLDLFSKESLRELEKPIKVLVNHTSIYAENFIVEIEVDIQRELKHANIVKMYTAFKSKYAIFFVLELMAGTLHSILENEVTKILPETKIACMTQDGRRLFYVAPPTERNLEIYKKYEGSDRPEKWIVEKLFEELQRVEIKKGYTAFIPVGYIHAVYTPEDSIVFGGNFLMDGHIDRHFEMTAVEEKALECSHIEVDNTFPNFENVMWRYTDKVVNERLQKPNPHWKDAIAPPLLRENLDVTKKPNRKLGTKIWYSKEEKASRKLRNTIFLPNFLRFHNFC